MPGDVADDQRDLSVGELDEVVEIAAHFARGAVERRDLPTRELRYPLRKELLLDELRDAHLLLETLAGPDLDLLLAHELRDPDRGRRLTCQLVEKPAVFARIFLVGEARAELEEPDQLALADERDDQPRAARAERLDGGRVELELVKTDRTARLSEIGEERVVWGDVDGRPFGRLASRGGCRALHIHIFRRGGAKPDHPPERPRPGHHSSSFLSAARPEIVTGFTADREHDWSSPADLAKPEARVSGRHGLPHRSEQVRTHGVQVDFVSEPVGERIEGARGVVARAVEAVVHRVLNAASDRLEERERHERGRRDR